MNLITPWKVQLACVNLSAHVDIEALAAEIHALHCASPRESKVPYTVTPEEFPEICQARDGIITEVVTDYIKQVFDHDPKNLRIDTFGKAFEKYQDLGAHLHGNSNVTSVFYPYGSPSGMLVFDPRGNASRGYPRPVRDGHFGNFYIQPEPGDLWIMPSYVEHSVSPVQEDLRLSMINDYFFD